ncbi:hypothetical protein KQX54_018102 [Cotesia glomerata]|uniref:Uncharacterized protein n=1 Tax=Cotesia glomerata TaxID=32391 RepID=A0AAV7ID39_COTGL|nr:hypothetical protein KQX54_018102 [Cotesia glomerata]
MDKKIFNLVLEAGTSPSAEEKPKNWVYVQEILAVVVIKVIPPSLLDDLEHCRGLNNNAFPKKNEKKLKLQSLAFRFSPPPPFPLVPYPPSLRFLFLILFGAFVTRSIATAHGTGSGNISTTYI